MTMDGAVDGVRVFRAHRLIWLFMEPGKAKKHKVLHYVYSTVIMVVLLLGFPTHLFFGLLQSSSIIEVFDNLHATIPATVVSLKTLCIWWKVGKVHKVDEIIRRLDRRISDQDEVEYYNSGVLPSTKRMRNLFLYLGVGASVFMQFGVIITGVLSEWRLMYRGYFPFDEYGSIYIFVVAHLYQSLGLFGVAFQGVANETYAPIGLIMIAGHVHMLRLRVSKLGSNPAKSAAENNSELVECIRAHKDLLELHRVLHDIISFYMLVQYVVAALNMCLVLINMIYYVDDIFFFLYYFIIWFAIFCEIFPCCYYGSCMEEEFHQLSQSIFSCNWVDQNKEFKQNFKRFLEQSLRRVRSEAGSGMIHINLNSFLSACRAAYSLFALLMQTK